MPKPLQRARRFVAHKDVSSASECRPKIFTFRANDADFDRYDDRLAVHGWRLDAYAANPVVLYMHDDGSGGMFGAGRTDILPIGKGRAYVQGDALLVDIEFDQDDEFARRVESKVEKGILNAVSVRYRMLRYHENERGGYDCDEQELLEISVVTIPGNQRAVRLKKHADDRVALIRDIADAVVKALGHKGRKKRKAAPPAAPPPLSESDTHALAAHTARALLQHLQEKA
ncbi:HK97 family phage prohead protease [Corallococcus sp. AS-1-12]|uniref:HK97 family phage prohead protease n=1 Tax=Corallococcus sp. AS-1-12 TaxID=2874598 RepID=UPI001CBDEC95|nr:HK97 family phage prohead protease [Corallococcus sp. AS-1-12]MBZ4335075.1 HK97 family phage prohead protease [Corallococcus sp. AS-1-12]